MMFYQVYWSKTFPSPCCQLMNTSPFTQTPSFVLAAVTGDLIYHYIQHCRLSTQKLFLHVVRKPTNLLLFLLFSVLASGIFNHCAGNDLGSIFCSDSSQLPHATVAQTALHHLLLSVWIWNYSYHPLDLAQWRHWCIYCTGKRKKEKIR